MSGDSSVDCARGCKLKPACVVSTSIKRQSSSLSQSSHAIAKAATPIVAFLDGGKMLEAPEYLEAAFGTLRRGCARVSALSL